MQNIIEKLYPYNAYLLGEGYDARLNLLNKELPLEILEFKSGTEFSTWTVPKEWVVKEAWVKYKGKKIIDFTKEPLSLLVYSIPFKGKIQKDELIRHLTYHNDFESNKGNAIPYMTSFYEEKWGFSVTKDLFDTLKDGEYEVCIDTEFKDGVMKLGVHTIPGETDREILLFAHLDHPYQANDNLSGVACLLDIAKQVKSKHTIKLIFCPETIGSIAYAHTQDLSKAEFVIAVDICGNDQPLLILKAYDNEAKINRIAHCACQIKSKPFRKGKFRSTIGSDETVFNDPEIGVPGICLSTHPYDEYHTNLDTPDKINWDKIKETAEYILKVIEIAGKDYIPKRNFKGPLMRSRYKIQSGSKQVNLNYDYFFYALDGKKSLAEICAEYELNFETMYGILEQVIKEGKITK